HTRSKRDWSSDVCSSDLDDFGFILQQRGIFSYSGLSREQMVAMRERYSVYGIESGRICVAALNSRNLDYVADAIAATVRISEGRSEERRVGKEGRCRWAR